MPYLDLAPTPIDGSAADDLARAQSLLDRVAGGELDFALRIWAPVPVLALSRLDELRPGSDTARAAAQRAGFDVIRRISGGHAVVAGAGSLCVGFAEPATTFEGTQERYERLVAAILAALADVGIDDAEQGELEGEWCPGAWSIRARGVKLAGLAQRAVKGAAWADAVIELAPDEKRRALLAEAYAALELPLDPATLGSVSELAGREVRFEQLAAPLRARLEPESGA